MLSRPVGSVRFRVFGPVFCSFSQSGVAIVFLVYWFLLSGFGFGRFFAWFFLQAFAGLRFGIVFGRLWFCACCSLASCISRLHYENSSAGRPAVRPGTRLAP